jgi:diguanylate cyclase (GGDEF)-like protein
MRSVDGITLAATPDPAVHFVPLALSALTLAGLVALLVVCLSQRRRLAALERVSSLDPLTGLLCGRFFDAERWPVRLRSAAPLAVLYIDLDDLKRINDRDGHAAGDQYIAEAASRLRRAVRRGVDEVVRLHSAGDEFLIVLSCPTSAQAQLIAEGVLCRLREGALSASIGVAFTASTAHRDRAALLEQAESAMREAKRRGRSRVMVQTAPSPASAAADRDCAPEPIDDYATRAYRPDQAETLPLASRGAAC